MSFADIAKSQNDFFTDGFNSGYNGEWSSSGNNKNALTITAKTDGTTTSATFKPKWTLRNYNLEFKPTFDTTGAAKLELVNTDKIAKGIKISGTADSTKKEFVANGEYSNDDINIKATLTGPWAKRPTKANVSALYNHGEYSVGGSLDLELGDKPKLGTANAGLRHSTDRYVSSGTLSLGDKKTLEGGFVYHLQSKKGDLATKFTYNINEKTSDVWIGWSHTNAEGDSWKSKIGSSGRAAVSHTREWNANTKVTTSVDFDALNLADHKFGVQVKFTQ